jgi:hypothetical protein
MITYNRRAMMLAYDLDRDMWLQGLVNDRKYSQFEEDYMFLMTLMRRR